MKFTSSQANHNYVIATSLLNIDKALNKFGLDSKHELQAMGFEATDFRDANQKISYSQLANILQTCIDLTGCEHFACELAELQTSAINGYFGMLIRTAASLENALRLASHKMHMYSKGAVWRYQRDGALAYFQLLLDAEHLSPQQHQLLVELSLAQGWFILRNQTSGPMPLRSIQFVRSPPKDERPYQSFFGTRLQFNCDADRLVLDASQLNQPMSHADPYLHRAIGELAQLKQDESGSESLADEVRSFIRLLLPQGNCSIEEVASHLMRDKRSLQRHLQSDHQVTFKELLQDERLKLVQMYLTKSQKSVTEIAYATGYSVPSNMARAFRQKFGCTPQQWREQQLSSQN